MSPHVWKMLGRAGLASVLVAMCIVGRSDKVAGDPVDSSAPAPGDPHVPGTLYDLGPGAILYERQSAEEQDNIDRVAATLEALQPAASHEAFARAADQAVIDAQAEIAERQVGLEGVEDQGVQP
jgi:hypothetical protein